MLIYVLFVIGFFLLIKGAGLLVDGAASIAKKLGISAIVVGLTIVAFGTSAPEFVVNMIASTEGNTDLVIGNILGSNIANILLILGVSAIIYPVVAKRNTTLKEIPFALLAAVVLGVFANDQLIDGGSISQLTRIDGIVLICFFIIFLYYAASISKDSEVAIHPEIEQKYSIGKSILYIVGGLAGLVIGGKRIVDGAVHIATLFNVSQAMIGLTVVAIGTSLPELATSVVAARKHQTDIALGNIVGSNIFNIFRVLGASALIRPIPFSPTSSIDLIIMIGVSILLLAAMYIGKRDTIERRRGYVFVGLYIVYMIYLVMSQ